MKKEINILFIVILFILGIGFMSYPFISDYLARLWQADIVSEYNEQIDSLSDTSLDEALDKAKIYNENLLGNIVLTDPFDANAINKLNTEYEKLLDFNDDGVMAYIEIPAINVYLPIFHGTSQEVLEKGCGHLINTSLPIGGKGTHSVLSAHSGLPSAKLFTDLNKLKENDIFSINVLKDKLTYQVDQIKVVEPDDTKDLYIDINKDYVTLVTCTPYGINSHRLLVRGTRIENIEEEKEAIAMSEKTENTNLKYAYLSLIPTSILLLIIAFIIYKKKNI